MDIFNKHLEQEKKESTKWVYECDGKLSNLDETFPKIPQPKYIAIELKEHQKTAVYAMRTLETNQFITYTPTAANDINFLVLVYWVIKLELARH
jgi:hypothetical protein